jgi:hypothetical protein
MSRRVTLAITFAATLVAGCGTGQEGVDSQAVDSAGASDAALARAGAGGAATRVLCSGSPETISGVVVSVGGGGGLTINTGTTSETVYGLGPSWYWSQNGVARPVVGDSVVVVVSLLITTEERVILSITVDGQPLTLRDPSTCAPLW